MAEVAQDPGRLAALLSASQLAIIAADNNAIVTEWSGAADELFGWTAEEMIGEPLARLWPTEEDLDRYEQAIEGVHAGFHSWRRRKDGSIFLAEIRASPIIEDGAPIGMLGLCRDVTNEATRNAEVDRILAASKLAVIGMDQDRLIRSWGGAAEALHGWTADETIGRPIEMLWPNNAVDTHDTAVSKSQSGETTVFQAWRAHKDGTTFLAELTVSPTTTTDRWNGSVSISRDITAEYTLQRRAEAAERRFAAAFGAAALPLIMCELDGTIVEANDAYALLAARVEPPATVRFLDLIEPVNRPPLAAALGTLATDPGRFEGIEVPIAGSDHHILNLSIAPVDDGPDAPPLALVQLIDVSDQLRIQTELAEIATIDPLTQVFNRSCFEPLLASFPDGLDVGMFFVDLDHFKNVNDERGHAAGDHVLQTVAGRLEAIVRDTDFVVRFGGDEFVIVCPTLAEPGAAKRLGERLRRSVAQPIDIEGTPVRVSASIGVALVQAGPELQPDAAIAAADAAMYEAKAAGRDTTVIAPLH